MIRNAIGDFKAFYYFGFKMVMASLAPSASGHAHGILDFS